MKQRKKLHNALVNLKGNIRVYCRVRPLIREDGDGRQTENVVSFDEQDDGILMVNDKGKMKKFEMEKVFPPVCSQVQVRREEGRKGGREGIDGLLELIVNVDEWFVV